MKNKIFAIAAVFLFTGAAQAQQLNIPATFQEAEQQTKVMLAEIDKAKNGSKELVSPRTIEKDQLRLVKSGDWTSGFFPGELWYLYEYSKNTEWKKRAESFTANIEKEQWNGGTHDMGFKVYCSVGNGYRLTKDQHYKEVLMQAAKTLSTRFNKTAGVIRSWDHNKQKWEYPVIIDNMLNLELLFEASKLTGDKTYYNIAVSHANKTMQNHFRPDYSSYHVVDYDSTTGKVIKRTTHQGYSDASAWPGVRPGVCMAIRCVTGKQRIQSTCSRRSTSPHLFLTIPTCQRIWFRSGILTRRGSPMNRVMFRLLQ